MRIVFFGTSEFALPSLEAILKSTHQVLAVVTQPDRRQGRKLILASPPVKTLTANYNLKIYQPLKVSSPDFIAALKEHKPDVLVVVSFGQILNKELLKIAKYFSINLHGSLLPKYRGPAPVNWAIINNETTTGITVIKVEEKVDSGDILLKKEIAIDSLDNAFTLNKKLSLAGAPLLLEALNLIEQEKISFSPQDQSQVSVAPKLKKNDGLIDWSEEAVKIHNKVRGLFPWPGTFTDFGGKTLKILDTELAEAEGDTQENPGVIIRIIDNGVMIQTGQGQLLIKQLQLEGSKPMSAKQFTLGHQVKVGTRL